MFFSYASDSLPSVEEFKKVLGAKGENADNIEELSFKDFDPRSQYRDVIEKVKQAGEDGRGKRGVDLDNSGPGAKVFRVEIQRARVEYYIVAVGERSLVGVVAKAVES